MKTLYPSILLVGLAPFCLAAERPSAALPRSIPEMQGISSPAIQSFVEAADRQIDAMHSFMLVRHGQVVAEGWWTPYSSDTRHLLHSLSKSFTSTAVGLAIGEGKLSVDDDVLKFFPEDAPAEPSANLKALRVRDLLSMSTGHQTEPSVSGTPVWTKTFLAQPVQNKPGTHFLYNTPATFMLSAIVQKVTGMTVLDYLRPRLFEPLGIENPTWGTNPQGITFGGYGLSVRTEDIARFGQLYLQKGEWRGRQLVPAAWIESATARQTSNGSNPKSDWEQGYGYQFWRCRHGIYRGDGAFGQFCIVMPELDVVIAITAGTRDMQAVLNLVWDKLLPAFHKNSIPAAPDSHEQLQQTLANLALRPQQGPGAPASTANWLGQKYEFPANEEKIEAAAVERSGDSVNLMLRCNGVEQRIACGKGAWTRGKLAYGAMPEQPVAASGAWTDASTFVAKLCFYETPTVVTLTLRFSGEKLDFASEFHAAFGPGKRPELTGVSR